MPSLTEKDAAMERVFNLRQELDRTKKKLDIAVDALKEIKYVGSWAYVGGLASEFTEPEIAQQALEQITALEQKEE